MAEHEKVSRENVDQEENITMVDFLAEEEKLEADAKAVLGGSDPKNCTYPQGYLSRQALYACSTCTPDPAQPAGICLACSYECHEGHELFELYTKRNFKCDCGNKKFPNRCKLFSEKSDYNELNQYSQNFVGKYCTCKRPYPDPEDDVDDEMFQCVICEDWYHQRHLNADFPEHDDSVEVVCSSCMKKCPFLWAYQAANTAVKIEKCNENVDVDVESHKNKLQSDGCADTKQTKDSEEKKSTQSGESFQKKNEDGNPSDGDNLNPVEEKCVYRQLQNDDVILKEQSTYWKEGWRSYLCSCSKCLEMYKSHKVAFLLDEKDPISVYEEQGQQFNSNAPTGMEALSKMNRVQQMEVIHGYNDLKSELTDYLKKFADSKKVVREEDIREFFTGLEARKRQRTNTIPSHFCK
ncbi:putative E3 ubiquitin-protein ligase UBR7 [Octopus bimaculoides]|uniref:UBR-type domain-containing protein n=1 Tax=Octopus bimaculoides TaxID=37653 RepID=A0A0L8FKW7_OCTBM|nr:putative E3 ubiquitin-protein ligase UBR7 [Octopus bimaculoides]|eukprot:XP_014788965.1 PREDICTED: putative E3 ubiquitin-protein ligase UBR7 [Octopus bimaculoides]